MESRPDWDTTFLDICETLSKRATCCKYKTAAIVVRDTNILSMGYNGVRAGAQHCSDYFGSGGADISGHREWSARFEIHAEMNALLKCKENLAGATLYTLFSPCSQCAKNIVAAGIKKVVYREPYKREFYAGCATLEMSGVELCHCARQ